VNNGSEKGAEKTLRFTLVHYTIRFMRSNVGTASKNPRVGYERKVCNDDYSSKCSFLARAIDSIYLSQKRFLIEII